MSAITTVARQAFIGGNSLRHYCYLVVFILLMVSVQFWFLHKKLALATENGDPALAEMLKAQVAFLTLTVALPIVKFLAIAGAGVVSEEFRSRTITMVLTRISVFDYLVGGWIGLMLFLVAQFVTVLLATCALIGYFAVPVPAALWPALISTFATLVLAYTVTFVAGAIFKKPMVVVIGLIIASGIITGFAAAPIAGRLGSFSAVCNFLSYFFPASLPGDQIQLALRTSHTSESSSIALFVTAENILYAGALLLIGLFFLQRREPMSR